MRTKIPLEERLRALSVEQADTGCWTWQARLDDEGYGRLTIDGRPALAHRASYQTFVGPIPDGLVIDHLCRNRACINPAHLEPVTSQENVLRSPIAPASINAAKKACPQGHSYDAPNTYIQADGSRVCRTCVREHHRRYRAAHRSSKEL